MSVYIHTQVVQEWRGARGRRVQQEHNQQRTRHRVEEYQRKQDEQRRRERAREAAAAAQAERLRQLQLSVAPQVCTLGVPILCMCA